MCLVLLCGCIILSIGYWRINHQTVMQKPDIVPAQSVTMDMIYNHHQNSITTIHLSPITEGLDTREGTSFDESNENDEKSTSDVSGMYGNNQDIITPTSGQSIHETPKADDNNDNNDHGTHGVEMHQDVVDDDIEDSEDSMYGNHYETNGKCTMNGDGEHSTQL